MWHHVTNKVNNKTGAWAKGMRVGDDPLEMSSCLLLSSLGNVSCCSQPQYLRVGWEIRSGRILFSLNLLVF